MKLKNIFPVIIILITLFTPLYTSAFVDESFEKLWSFADESGYDSGAFANPGELVANVISVVLGFLGIIFLILTIYGGFMWMTAAGNEEQVEKAKKIIVRATIGLAIVLLAYTITYTVTRLLAESTGGAGGGGIPMGG